MPEWMVWSGLYLPEPWYLQWWTLLPASSLLIGGGWAYMAIRLFGSKRLGLIAWWVSTVSLAAFLWAPLWVIYALAIGFWMFCAAVICREWLLSRKAAIWTG